MRVTQIVFRGTSRKPVTRMRWEIEFSTHREDLPDLFRAAFAKLKVNHSSVSYDQLIPVRHRVLCVFITPEQQVEARGIFGGVKHMFEQVAENL